MPALPLVDPRDKLAPVPSGRPRAFLGSGSPGRSRGPARYVWRGHEKTPPKLSAREGSKVGTGGLPFRRLLREQRACRHKAPQRRCHSRSIDMFFRISCAFDFFCCVRGFPRTRDAAFTPDDSSSQACASHFFSSATRRAAGMVIGPAVPIVTCVVSQTPTQASPLNRPQPMSNEVLPKRVTPRPTS